MSQANNDVNWTSVPALPFMNNFEKDIESILGLLYQVSMGYSDRICEDSQRDLTSVINCLWGITTRYHSTGEYNPLVDVQPESHDQHDSYLRQQVDEIDEIMDGDFEEAGEFSILPASPPTYDIELPLESDYTQSSDAEHVHSPESDHTQSSDLGSPTGDQGPTTPQCPGEKRFYCTYPGCTVQKPFKYLSKLRDHVRKHQPASIQCPECKQMFKQERILKKHLFRIHKLTDKNQKAVKDTASPQASSVHGQDQMQADQPQVQSPSPDTSAVTPMKWGNNIQDVGFGGIILMEGSLSIDHLNWASIYN